MRPPPRPARVPARALLAPLTLFGLAATLPGCTDEKPDPGTTPTGADSAADSTTGADSAADSHTGDSATTPAGYPWSDPAFWSDPGPLASRLAPDTVEMGRWQVRMATSPDGQTWTASPDIIAYGFSSLDLLNTGSGLILSGVVEFIDGNTVLLEMPSILALVTQDLQTWNSVRFPIADATRLWVIDPALRLNSAGTLEAHWFGTDQEGDPAGQPGPHEVYRAAWDGSTLRESALVFSHEFLADPSVCDQTVDGQLQEWMFFTLNGAEVHHARQSGPAAFTYAPDPFWQSVNVPWCEPTPDRQAVTVYAQNTGGGGPAWRLDIAPSGTTTRREQFYSGDLFGYDNCTSPAVTYFQDQYVLFCAVYTTR